LKETLKLYLSVCPRGKCIFNISAPVCRLLSSQAYGLLFKRFLVKVGYYRSEGLSHGYTSSLVTDPCCIKYAHLMARTNKINRLLAKYNIQTIEIPARKISICLDL
jgi:hypothetical protein